ncbi:MAG: ATP-binding protein [Myxococcota bacterium]
MRDGRKMLDDLRDVFQDGIDDLEKKGGRHLDRAAERGLDEASRAVDRAKRRVHSKKGRHRRSRGRGRSARRAAREAAEGLSPEERERMKLVRRARRRANQRIGFITHFGTYVATLAIVLLATRSLRVVTFIALGWGIGIFMHYLFAMSAPKLRDRWVEKEVGTRAARDVRTERREVGTRSRRSLEDLSASIAHEIRNPITAAKSLVQQMGEDPASDENLEYAGLALSELDRVERSISHLLRYARDEEPRFEALHLRTVATAAVSGLQDRATIQGVDLRIDFEGQGEMRGDGEKLRRVIENLIANAIEAAETASSSGADASRLTPRVDVQGGENLAGDEVWLRVLDNGPGIPADEIERVWSPFFTTKATGTGLGLALSRKTVEAHGGRIEIHSEGEQGCEFVLVFAKDPAEMNAPEGGNA